MLAMRDKNTQLNVPIMNEIESAKSNVASARTNCFILLFGFSGRERDSFLSYEQTYKISLIIFLLIPK